MLSCYSWTSPFLKPCFCSPLWVIWCSPTPGLRFCGYLTPALSPFQQDICAHIFSPLYQQLCLVPPFPFSIKSILPFLLTSRSAALSVPPELWGSQLILYKSCIWLIKQWESPNIESHQTLVGKEITKQTKQKTTCRDGGFGFFFPKIHFECKDTVLVVVDKSKIARHLNIIIKYYNLFLKVKANNYPSICEIIFPFLSK